MKSIERWRDYSPLMGESDTYTPHVVAYLHSIAGRDTQPTTAARLRALGPGQLGMSCPPTPAQLHNTRRMFDDLARLDRERPHYFAIRCA